jgi:hypothetical protein
MWNSSWNPQLLAGSSGTLYWQWRPRAGQTYDWTRGIQWNVTVPDVPGTQTITSIRGYNDGIILAAAGSMDIGYSATTGEMLWNKTRDALPDIKHYLAQVGNIPFPMGGPCLLPECKGNNAMVCFCLLTGENLWGPSDP